MEEPINEHGYSSIIDLNKNPEFAEKERADARNKAIELIKKSDNFIVVGIHNNHTAMVSGTSLGQVPYILHAISKWLKFCTKAKTKIDAEEFLGES